MAGPRGGAASKPGLGAAEQALRAQAQDHDQAERDQDLAQAIELEGLLDRLQRLAEQADRDRGEGRAAMLPVPPITTMTTRLNASGMP